MGRILLTISIYFFFSVGTNAQDLNRFRELQPNFNGIDTILVKYKTGRNGEIKKMIQEYYTKVNGENYHFEEDYKKNKYWYLWQYKEINSSNNKISYVVDGEQIMYSQKGQIISIQHYSLGEVDEIRLVYEYYPDNCIKYIAEVKKNRYWNFIQFLYPDGTNFDFGNFKNGVGSFTMLDDLGIPCVDFESNGRRIKKVVVK